MMRFLIASSVLLAGSFLVRPALADHGYYGGRAYYPPPTQCAPAYNPYAYQQRGYGGYQVRNYGYRTQRSYYSPYQVHNQYRNLHHNARGGYYGGSRGGVSLYGPRGGFSIRF